MKSLIAHGKNLMLKISDRQLKQEAKSNGYRPEIVEKVYHLLELLKEYMAVPYIADRLVLKGGTAINLFCTNHFPRLSVDLDFNYIGSAEREVMQQEKLTLEDIMLDIAKRRQYELHRNPKNHAGGKKVLIYQSVLGNKGRLELDLNYVYRVPLWETEWRESPVWPKAIKTKVLDIHELAAGKLSALIDREASRDLYDSHQLLTQWPLNIEKLRLAFTVYTAMRRQSWQQVTVDQVRFTIKDIRDKLIPVLKASEAPRGTHTHVKIWAEQLLDECKSALSQLLPFNKNEIEFLKRFQEYGELKPELISDDKQLCQRIEAHPLLHWRKLSRLQNT